MAVLGSLGATWSGSKTVGRRGTQPGGSKIPKEVGGGGVGGGGCGMVFRVYEFRAQWCFE